MTPVAPSLPMDFTPLRIRLPFGSEEEFIARYGVHVGRDGFFLATRAPKAPGTQLAFELVLSDGSPLLSGEGVVARTVAGARSGMVVRFLRLDGAGATLVERILAARPVQGPPSTAGGAPTTEGSPPARATEAPISAPPTRVPPEPALADHPASNLAVPLDEASTWPGDRTRDAARIAAAGHAAVPAPAPPAPPEVNPTTPGEVEPGVPRSELASTSPTAALPRPVPAPPPSAPASPVAPPSPALAPLPGAPARPVAPPPPVASEPHPVPTETAPPPEPVAPPPDTASDVPFHLRPTPALGVPRTVESPREAQVHTAVTPVRGIPALGPDVVAFLTGSAPTRPNVEPAPPPPAPVEAPASVPPPTPRPPAGAAVPATTATPAPESPGASPIAEPPAARTLPLDDVPTPVPTPATAPPFAPRGQVARPSPPSLTPSAGPLPARASAGDGSRLEAPPKPSVPAEERRPPPVATPDLAIPLPAPSTAQPVTRRSVPPATRVPATDATPAPPSDGALPAVEARTDAAAPPAPVPTETPSAATPEAGLPAAVLGLDIGTTSARVAWAHDGRADVLPADAEGTTEALPCRLVRDAHGVLRALQPGEADEALWVGSPVTLLGTHANSPAIRTLVRRWPVPVVPDERGEVAFDWGGVTVTAVELVATLLRSLKASAERRTGRSCTQAVLVVPAAFTLLQRARLREAAERAGLTVLRLLNAPTAAALAFAQDRGMARRRILVWRMGAATCDAAVVAVSGNDLDVVSSGGDGSLGGVNFDEQLALALDKTARTDPARLRLRVAQAERCKQTLSTSERGLVPPVSDGEPVIEVTRADLELRTSALVERSVLLAQEVLRAAGVTAESLDALVLSGGMAQVPHVRRAVEAAFGKAAATGTDPLAAPALGAALLGAALSLPPTSGRARSNVVEVLAVALEAVAPEFGHQRALERNTRLPAEKTLTLTLPAGQPLEVLVFQGMARAPDPRSFIGLVHAAGVDRAGEWALHLALSADGLFQAAATPPAGKRRSLQLQAAPAPAEPTAAADAGADEADPGARLLGGLKRLFGRR